MLSSVQNYLEGIFNENIWIIQIFAIVFAALLIDFLQKKILRRVQLKLKKTQSPWDDAFVHAVIKPLTFLVWLLGLVFSLEIIGFKYADQLKEVSVIIFIGWSLIRLIRFVEENIIRQHEIKGRKVDKTTADAVAQLLRISVLITMSLVISRPSATISLFSS